jgi:hypothetical protein
MQTAVFARDETAKQRLSAQLMLLRELLRVDAEVSLQKLRRWLC